ncbi:cell wall anchor protein, partial [Staphylococcus epidermidis]
SRFLSNGISSVDVIGSPSTGPYFVTSSTGGV